MNNQKKVFILLLLLVTAAVAFLLQDYVGVVSLAILLVLMFNPVYKNLLNRFKGNKNLSTLLTMIFISLSLIIPVMGLIFFTGYQVNAVAQDLQDVNFSRSDLGRITEETLAKVNTTLSDNSINYEITSEQLNKSLNQLLSNSGSWILGMATSFGSRIPELITQLILLIVLLAFLFPAQDSILKGLRKISPLSIEITDTYLAKISAMSRSMINGTFVIAFVQAIIGGLTLWMIGIPYPLFFFLILLVASIIPLLGSGLIMITAGLVFIATGNVIGGVIILAIHFIIISNIDNVLRPKLVEADAKLPEAITLLGIIAGITVFGIKGLVFGPVIMVIAYTTYEIYLNYYAISVKNYLND